MKYLIINKSKYYYKLIKQTLYLMIGIPDCETYVKYTLENNSQPMTYDKFIENRIKARYGDNNGSKCC